MSLGFYENGLSLPAYSCIIDMPGLEEDSSHDLPGCGGDGCSSHMNAS